VSALVPYQAHRRVIRRIRKLHLMTNRPGRQFPPAKFTRKTPPREPGQSLVFHDVSGNILALKALFYRTGVTFACDVCHTHFIIITVLNNDS